MKCYDHKTSVIHKKAVKFREKYKYRMKSNLVTCLVTCLFLVICAIWRPLQMFFC